MYLYLRFYLVKLKAVNSDDYRSYICFSNAKFCENEWRAIIHFLHKEGLTQTEAANRLHRHYGDLAPDRSTVSRWMARFAAGREVLENDPRVGGQ